MKWFVLKTKPKNEIKVANALNSIGIKAFCPVINLIKQYSDRKKKIQKPALPSYVLVNISDKKRPDVFAIPGIVKYLFWLGKPAVVKNEEIDLLKKELDNLYTITDNINLKKGNNHILHSGPFKGLNGKIVNISNNKFKLELKNIGVYLTVSLA